MQVPVSVGLQESFQYSIILPIIFFIIIVLILFMIFKKKKNKQKIVIKEIEEKDLVKIKEKYIEQLNQLSKKIEKNQIKNRNAYQKLSEIIRNFVYEATDIKVQNYTLKEIRNLNLPPLYELIREYYAPEFSRFVLGNIKESVIKTRGVIEKWN